MKFFCTIFLLFVSLVLKAQITDIYNFQSLHEMRKDSNSYEMGVSYNTFVSSNSITNQFINSLYQKKYLSHDLRKANKITDFNSIGSADNSCLYFAHLGDSLFGYDHMGYRISLENSYHADAKFNRDLYNIVFFGNKDYAGKKADLSEMNVTFMRYQQVKFGLFKQNKDINNPFTIYFGLGLIKGQTYNSLNIDTTYLFTDESGENLDLKMQSQYFASDTNKTKFYDFNGVGACFDIAFTYEDKKSNYFINCSLSDIGFIWWNKKSMIVPMDTLFHWDGIAVDSILFGHDTTYHTSLSKDSLLKKFYAKSRRTDFIRLIPEKINISFTKRLLNNTLFATLGLSYLYNANCPYPLIYTRGDYFFKNKISTFLQFAYGGYGNFQCGIGVGAKFSKHFSLYLGTNNFLGFLLPEQTYSQSAFGRLSYSF